MALGIHRRNGDDPTLDAGRQVSRCPAGSTANRTRPFQRREESVGREWIKRPSSVFCFGAGAGIPILGTDFINRRVQAYFNARLDLWFSRPLFVC
jgi:hypothetical protein